MCASYVESSTPADRDAVGIDRWTAADTGILVAARDFDAWFNQITEWNLAGTISYTLEGATSTATVDETFAIDFDRNQRWGYGDQGREVFGIGVASPAGIAHPTWPDVSARGDWVTYYTQTWNADTEYQHQVGCRLRSIDSTSTVQKYLNAWAYDRWLVPLDISLDSYVERGFIDDGTGGNIGGDTERRISFGTTVQEYAAGCDLTIDFPVALGLSGASYTRALVYDPAATMAIGNDDGPPTDTAKWIADVDATFTSDLTMTPTALVPAP